MCVCVKQTCQYTPCWFLLFYIVTAYLDDLGVCTAAVPCGGVHPGGLWGGTLLPQGTLLVLYTPATLKPGVRLQTHPAAVPQRVALIQVGCGDGTVGKKT